MDQEKDRIDRIEKEVRVELVAEKAELCLQFFFFQELVAVFALQPAFCEFDAHGQSRTGQGSQ